MEEKHGKCAASENEISPNVSNKIIKTALVNQIHTALQWLDDAVSLLLKGDFACKENLESILESAGIIAEDFSVFEIKNNIFI